MKRPRIWWIVAAVLVMAAMSACEAPGPTANDVEPLKSPALTVTAARTATAAPTVTAVTTVTTIIAAPTATVVPDLPTSEEVVRAVADGVNVVRWPKQPTPGTVPRDRDACINGFDAATDKNPCVLGDPKGSHTMVIYGDSHAGMWAPALGIIGKEKGWRVVLLTLNSCPVPDFPTWSNEKKRRYTECDDFRASTLATIKELHPDVVLISSIFRAVSLEKDGKPTQEGLDQAWADGLGSMISRLKANAGRVVVIGDIAYPSQEPTDCLTAHPNDIRVCNTPRSKAVNEAHNQMEKAVTEKNGAQYVDTIPWFCTATDCPVVVAGLDVYRNRAHVGVNYHLWLRNALGTATGLLPY